MLDHTQLQQLIEANYPFSILKIVDAPRQFVAETYFVTTTEDTKYFVKVVNKQLFIPRIKASLPALNYLAQKGVIQINVPIANNARDYFIEKDNLLIVLFSFIDAPQSYEYSNYALGKLLARVHAVVYDGQLPVVQELFEYKHEKRFFKYLDKILKQQHDDKIRQELKHLLSKYKSELEFDFEQFSTLSAILKQKNHTWVFTHGDAPGNVLVKNADDIYLVDWDEITLAPPERDLWFLDSKDDFMSGYRSVFPDFKIDDQLKLYFMYLRYFNDLVEYFEEIYPQHAESHRKKNLQALKHDCFEGWLRPAIREEVNFKK